MAAAITCDQRIAEAADFCARAVREPYGRQPIPTRHGNALRLAGRALLFACFGHRQGATVGLIDLLEALIDIMEAFAEYREMQQRHFQAQAARKVSACLRGVSRPEAGDVVAGALLVRERKPNPGQLAATSFPAPLGQLLQRSSQSAPTPRRPAAPPPGHRPQRHR
ncbi:hypothetical protein [Actinomadura kijaniata]|uniref:hypothetical protein n=1 Tax=Actinomadura kijaniata TaxID=46161 RepID=UPI0012FBA8A0|nr:hypothetical protein [Actinomadura kijaniata]